MLALLDRDGVINVNLEKGVLCVSELELIDSSAQAIAELNRRDIKVAVITNQSAIGRGWLSEPDLHTIHQRLDTLLARYDAHIDAYYYCPDHPDLATNRRKPAPGMLEEALRDFAMKPNMAFVVGDSLRDMQAAHAAGCRRFLVKTGHGMKTLQAKIPPDIEPVEICENLAEAIGRLNA